MNAKCDRRLRAVGGTPAERIAEFTRIAQRSVEAPEIRRAAARCLRDTDADTAAACLALVQRLPYYPDPPGESDWISDPCHALVVGGDCEDLSVLLVALWAACGLTARVVWIAQPEAGQDHVSAEVLLPRAAGWLPGEGTVRGARLGEDPYVAAKRLQAVRARGGGL